MVSVFLLAIAFSIPLLIAEPVWEPSLPLSGGTNEPQASDSAVISFSHNGQTENISLSDYLVGVVAAEMPASFNIEALKAQTVAARTYALYKISQHSHQSFDVCDDSGCCSAYFDIAELKERWGSDYDKYIKKIRSAVAETDGLYLTWEDKPILAVFHSSSPGKTEKSENVWASSFPYLVSVESPETREQVKNLISTVTVSGENLKSTVLEKYPNAFLAGDPRLWISFVCYTESGRVKSLRVGGVEMSGSDFRFLLGLRSAAFTFEYDGNSFVFSVAGYGHGVGMSQYGANILAGDGALFDEILANYYPGTRLSAFSGTFPS